VTHYGLIGQESSLQGFVFVFSFVCNAIAANAVCDVHMRVLLFSVRIGAQKADISLADFSQSIRPFMSSCVRTRCGKLDLFSHAFMHSSVCTLHSYQGRAKGRVRRNKEG
jgi:hypothetical protein